MKTKSKKLSSIKLRKDLLKIMPGYKWTVHRPSFSDSLYATGIQTSGKNRLSTLNIHVQKKGEKLLYTSKSAGFGLRAPWLAEREGKTLAQSLRSLQDFYEAEGNNHLRHAADLQGAREQS